MRFFQRSRWSSAVPGAAPETAHSDLSASDPYDALPYGGGVYPYTDPRRLRAWQSILCGGLAPCSSLRILDAGCGTGGNLINLAALLPEASFVGIDAAARQIEQARSHAMALGLHNVAWRVADLVGGRADDLGGFDVIICHGVLSWIARESRPRLLDWLASHLHPQGVAYVSFNARPGWFHFAPLRDLLAAVPPAAGAPGERVGEARLLLATAAELTASLPPEHSFRQLIDQARQWPDEYLFHEFMAEHNDAILLREFAAEALVAGLAYCGEADGWDAASLGAEPALRSSLARIADVVERQQWLDFIAPRSFRMAILTHRTAVASAPAAHDRDTQEGRLAMLHLRAHLRPSISVNLADLTPVDFLSVQSNISFRAAFPLLKAACVELAECWPSSVPFPELAARAGAAIAAAGLAAPPDGVRALASALERAVVQGAVEAFASPVAVAAFDSARLRLWPPARWALAQGLPLLPTRWHENEAVSEEERHALRLCIDARDADAALPDGMALDLWQRGLLVHPTEAGEG